jgi:hypothetical protein
MICVGVRKLHLLAGVLICVAIPSVGIASAARDRIYVANFGCTGHSYKPQRITIACGDGNFYAAHLRYRSYGGPTAKAVGKLVQNDCVPSCVAGKFVSYPGAIKLSQVRACQGRLYYERIAWTFTGASPDPARRGSIGIKPQTCVGALASAPSRPHERFTTKASFGAAG